jgi:excinuclease ABC subunit C
MYEVVFRRYSRLLEEEGELPQLIVVDGGKGQLDFAYKALTDLNLNKKIPIIGIAKRLEELIIPGDPTPLFLDKNSPGLKLIMQLRDEAHRFGITFHRLKRSKGQINSELRDIKGIGEETEKKLLQRYKSVARIRELSEEELTEFAGAKVAQAIKSHFESHL